MSAFSRINMNQPPRSQHGKGLYTLMAFAYLNKLPYFPTLPKLRFSVAD